MGNETTEIITGKDDILLLCCEFSCVYFHVLDNVFV